VVRHDRLRKKVSGTTERPRLAVFRSLNNIYAQVIDDVEGKTVVSASSIEPGQRSQNAGKAKRDVAKEIGQLVAKRAAEAGIQSVVFDRGGHQYHGRVKALGDAAREGGLRF
jgi:large subunit ribosomal protein L18